MVMDVVARAGQGVGPAAGAMCQQPVEPVVGPAAVGVGAIHDFEELEQVAVDFDSAGGIGVAEVQIGIGDQPPERGAIVHDEPGHGLRLADADLAAVPQHDRDRRIVDRPEQSANQPALPSGDAAAGPAVSRPIGQNVEPTAVGPLGPTGRGVKSRLQKKLRNSSAVPPKTIGLIGGRGDRPLLRALGLIVPFPAIRSIPHFPPLCGFGCPSRLFVGLARP